MLDSNSAICQLANMYFSPRKMHVCSHIQLGFDLEMYATRTLAWHKPPSGVLKQQLRLSSYSPGASAGVELLTGRQDGCCQSGESWCSRYWNTTHCDCWETSNNLEQYFPNTASGNQTSKTHTDLQPASHNESIAHSFVTMKNIHVIRFKLEGFTI